MDHVNENPFLSPLNESKLVSASRPFPWKRLVFWMIGIPCLVMLIGVMLLPFSRRMPRGTITRITCQNNLRQIGIALHNYESMHGSLPPAFTMDEKGNRLHSWRTLILPFVEENQLYESIDLTKPWNDPVNREAGKKTPMVYRCPVDGKSSDKTVYLANVSASGAFSDQGVARKLSDFSDGTNSTVALFEVDADHSVAWMSPNDGDIDTVLELVRSKELPHHEGVHLAMADGSVRYVSLRNDVDKLRPFFTIDGNENADWP